MYGTSVIFIFTSIFTYSFVNAASNPKCVYTYTDQTGNRYAKGKGTFPRMHVHQFRPPQPPTKISYLIGIDTPESNVYWYGSDAKCLDVHCDARHVYSFVQPLRNWQATEPPIYVGIFDIPGTLFLPPYQVTIPTDASRLSHPACINDDKFAYITESGNVVLSTVHGRILVSRKLNAPNDGKIVVNDRRTVMAVYTDATNNRYSGGLFGDKSEAAEMRILRADTLEDIATVRLTHQAVFEGLSPMFADIDGDGRQDIIATMSDSIKGSTLIVFSDDGTEIARSDPTGNGGLWRHQLAVAPFGLDLVSELATVYQPHKNHRAEFFQFRERTPGEVQTEENWEEFPNSQQLIRVASKYGYSSHVFGSKNLDMAVAGDFNGDGQAELVVPSKSFRRIVGLQRTNSTIRSPHGRGLKEVWSVWLGERVVSNLAALQMLNGRLGLGLALANGTITVMMPV